MLLGVMRRGSGHLMSPLDRRRFLLLLSSAGIAIAGCRKDSDDAPREPAGTPGPGGTIGEVNVDVIVVGAGVAGLVAARELRRAGKRVILVGARDRVGGRVQTSDALGVPLDLGAAWIHGSGEDQPLVAHARECGVRTVVTDFDEVALHVGSTRVDKEARRRSQEDFRSAIERVRTEGKAGEPLGAIFRRAIAELGLDGDAARLVDWQLAAFENDYAEESDRLDARQFDRDSAFAGDDLLLLDGYRTVMDGLARDLDVRLSHRVQAIDHTGDRVRVETDRGMLFTQQVIVTLPLGVLKQGSVAFNPELPDRKRAAIRKLGVGAFMKVALRFPQAFWPTDRAVLGLAGRSHGEFPLFLSVQANHDAPILVGMVVGNVARELETAPDEEVLASAQSALRAMFGAAIPAPTAHAITRWGVDPFALGAYSGAAVGVAPDDYEALPAPVGSKLFFAGEATAATHNATVHAALLSGIREAKRIAAP